MLKTIEQTQINCNFLRETCKPGIVWQRRCAGNNTNTLKSMLESEYKMNVRLNSWTSRGDYDFNECSPNANGSLPYLYQGFRYNIQHSIIIQKTVVTNRRCREAGNTHNTNALDTTRIRKFMYAHIVFQFCQAMQQTVDTAQCKTSQPRASLYKHPRFTAERDAILLHNKSIQ